MVTPPNIPAGPRTLICVPIMVRGVEQALAQAALAREAGADVVEFRVDEFFTGELEAPAGGPHRVVLDVVELLERSPIPCILTCRSAQECGGVGGFEGTDDERVSLLERALRGVPVRSAHGPAYIDFEWGSVARSREIGRRLRDVVRCHTQPSETGPGLIISTHDFSGPPGDLGRRLLGMQSHESASVVKVAFHARTLRDNLEVFDLLRDRQRPMIALAMGEYGLMSRVLAPKFGAFLTFAALRPAETTAPGQPTVAELIELYRFSEIRPSTRVYGIVGWPVGHSLSPLVHNAAFGVTGHDGVYLPLPIPTIARENSREGDQTDNDLIFRSTLLSLIEHDPLSLSGLSVTLPHKERLVRLARERGWQLDAASMATGAANTLVVDRGAATPECRVYNTDIDAAVGLLQDMLGSLSGKSVAVVGAGGVGRAIAWGLASSGASVSLYARDAVRAAAAADEIERTLATAEGSIRGESLPPDHILDGHEAYINATPVGMVGGPDPLGVPFIVREATSETVVFDTVYNPVRTPLLDMALARSWEQSNARGAFESRSGGGWGCRAIDGAAMFVRQASAQSRLFTGKDTDHTALFDRLVRARLSPAPEGKP